MSAIITDYFKSQLVQNIFEDVADSAQNYYIGIGRSQDWDSSDTPTVPINSLREELQFRLNMQSVKRTADVSFVVPRKNWSSGSIYSGYNTNQVGQPTNSHYVITDNNSVYICLEQGKSASGAGVASTVKPTSSASTPFKTADGYVWKFLYTLAAVDANKYLSANYMPVKLQDATDSASSATAIEQYSIQQAAVDGQVAGITLTSGGSGYTSAPTVTIIGDGDSAEAVATILGGSVVKVEMRDSASTIFNGSGYNYANVVFSGGAGIGAAARANLSYLGGFGSDPRIDLKSTALMFNAKPSGAENEDFIIGQDFRQVALMRNIKNAATDSDYSSETGSALDYMTLSSISTAFSPDRTILGGTSGAKAYVDRFDSDKIYYHQTEATGFIPFQSSESVTETDGAGSGVIGTPLTVGDINKFKGEVFYIDNRAAIERSAAQTEDLKIIIQL